MRRTNSFHIKFSNSIISNNPQGGCGPAGLFDDAGHNLQFPGTDCGESINVADPHLDSMYMFVGFLPIDDEEFDYDEHDDDSELSDAE